MHTRRGFFDTKGTDEVRAVMAMAFIRLLHAVADEAEELSDDARKALRQERAKPILDLFKVWLDRSSQRYCR